MNFETKKQEFIASWGVLGQQWGVNKAMSQIHALLLVSTRPLTSEEIMQELQMSRGNVSMNLRSLIDWGLIEKVMIPGLRKEHFKAEKDVLMMTKRIAIERRKREVEPTLKLLKDAASIPTNTPEAEEFVKITSQLAALTEQLDTILSLFAHTPSNSVDEAVQELTKLA